MGKPDEVDVVEGAEILARIQEANPDQYQEILSCLRNIAEVEDVLDGAPLVLRTKRSIRQRRYKA